MIKPFKMSLSDDKKTGEIFIYGEITRYEWEDGDVSSWSFKDELEEIKDADTVIVRINSYGGSVSEGFAIYNLIKDLPQKTIAKIDGFACSIASVIPMACDEIHMSQVSAMMIHKPFGYSSGNSDQLRKQANELDTLLQPSINAYMSKVNIPREELLEMLKEDTWLTCDIAFEMGFCTHITGDDITQSFENEHILSLVNQNLNLKNQLLHSSAKSTKQLLNEYFS